MEHFGFIKDAIFLIGIGFGVPLWVISQVKKGQKENFDRFQQSITTFGQQLESLRKQYKKSRRKMQEKVSRQECEKIRSVCTACLANQRGQK